ncbi:MAG: sulfocyanin-like copper-binding protein [Candidatus Limnocylindria bacterium]
MVPVMALLSVACTPADGGLETSVETAGGGGPVEVTLEEWSVAVAPASAAPGEVTFEVSNQGSQTHNFVVFRTDLAPDQLPVESAQVVAGDGVAEVGRIDEVGPGSAERLSLSLQPGSYVLICNVPGHYQQGMHTAFNVES